MSLKCFDRKGQLSIFIIIGIVLILAAVASFIVLTSLTKNPNGHLMPTKDKIDQDSLKANLQSCLAKSDEIINKILINGGEMVFAQPAVRFDGISYRYWCKSDQLNPRIGCVNLVYSKQRIEQEISDYAKMNFENCINLSFYESAGFKVEADDSKFETLIGTLDVQLNVQKKIRMTKSGQDIVIDTISRSIPIPAGRMIDLANDILNEEISKGYFDKDSWMKKNGAEIEIEKHKPYPDTVYHLMRHNLETDTWTELNFAIKGIDTVQDVTKDYTASPSKWCMIGNSCFFNPDAGNCPTGILNNKPTTCVNSSAESYPQCGVPGKPVCDQCGRYKNGEEWCQYDSSPGLGYDFVGTRHYLKSCVDGIIYTEECRDYREEMCVHKGSGVNSDALCRPNRWKSCMSQQSQSSCNDQSQRDCFWYNDYLSSGGQFSKSRYPGDKAVSCFPQVPPGFRFWEMSGLESCNLGIEWIDCDGLSCPKMWSQSSMLSCMRLGDCGKKYTYSGAFGDVSFKTTDLYKQPESIANLKLPGIPYLGTSFYFDLPPYNYVKENYNPTAFNCTDCTIDEMLTRMDEYLNYVEGLDADDIMWDIVWDGETTYHTRQFSLCMPFVLDDSGDCTLCDNDPSIPCTEYRCRSSGNNCKYYVDADGYGKCVESTLSVDSPEVIAGSLRVSPTNSFSTATFATTILGKKLNNDVNAYTELNFTFDTTKKAICKLSVLPISYTDMPISFSPGTLDIGETNYSFNHKVTVYAIPDDYLKETIDKVVRFSSYLDMLNPDSIILKMDQLAAKAERIAEDADQDASQIRTKYQELKQMYTTEVKPSVDYYYTNYNRYVSSILLNAENEVHTTFINCMDENGNENTKQFFVSYKIRPDHLPPLFVSAPDDVISTIFEANLTVSLSTNEPSVCKMSFADEEFDVMPYNMSCPNSIFNFGRSFPCTGVVAKSKNPTYSSPTPNKVIYVRCRDKPYLNDTSMTNIMTTSLAIDYN